MHFSGTCMNHIEFLGLTSGGQMIIDLSRTIMLLFKWGILRFDLMNPFPNMTG